MSMGEDRCDLGGQSRERCLKNPLLKIHFNYEGGDLPKKKNLLLILQDIFFSVLF